MYMYTQVADNGQIVPRESGPYRRRKHFECLNIQSGKGLPFQKPLIIILSN